MSTLYYLAPPITIDQLPRFAKNFAGQKKSDAAENAQFKFHFIIRFARGFKFFYHLRPFLLLSQLFKICFFQSKASLFCKLNVKNVKCIKDYSFLISTVQHCKAPYSPVKYSPVKYSPVQPRRAQFIPVQPSTAQYSPVEPSTAK